MEKTLKNNPRNGRKCKINEYIHPWIIRQIKQNLKISAVNIAVEFKNNLNINVCSSRVHNFLQAGEYRGRIAHRKYFING